MHLFEHLLFWNKNRPMLRLNLLNVIKTKKKVTGEKNKTIPLIMALFILFVSLLLKKYGIFSL